MEEEIFVFALEKQSFKKETIHLMTLKVALVPTVVLPGIVKGENL